MAMMAQVLSGNFASAERSPFWTRTPGLDLQRRLR